MYEPEDAETLVQNGTTVNATLSKKELNYRGNYFTATSDSTTGQPQSEKLYDIRRDDLVFCRKGESNDVRNDDGIIDSNSADASLVPVFSSMTGIKNGAQLTDDEMHDSITWVGVARGNTTQQHSLAGVSALTSGVKSKKIYCRQSLRFGEPVAWMAPSEQGFDDLVNMSQVGKERHVRDQAYIVPVSDTSIRYDMNIVSDKINSLLVAGDNMFGMMTGHMSNGRKGSAAERMAATEYMWALQCGQKLVATMAALGMCAVIPTRNANEAEGLLKMAKDIQAGGNVNAGLAIFTDAKVTAPTSVDADRFASTLNTIGTSTGYIQTNKTTAVEPTQAQKMFSRHFHTVLFDALRPAPIWEAVRFARSGSSSSSTSTSTSGTDSNLQILRDIDHTVMSHLMYNRYMFLDSRLSRRVGYAHSNAACGEYAHIRFDHLSITQCCNL
jgi:hypothetical protein